MKLKSLPTFTVRSTILAIVAVHALPILFVMNAEAFLNQWLPSIFMVLIPLFIMLYRTMPTKEMPSKLFSLFKITGLAVGSFLALFLIGYFSTTYQPLIEADGGGVQWVVIPASESMAYVIRLFLQAWLFALVCVMAGRWLTALPDRSGFISRLYERRELFSWVMDLVVMGGALLFMITLMVLAIQQLSYLGARLLGFSDIFAFPQLSVFLFLLSLFILNKATSFSKRMLHYAKKPNTRMGVVYLGVIAFVTGVWVFSQAAILGVPESMQFELAQAMNIPTATLDGFAKNWPVLMLSCSFYLVAPLSVMLSRILDSGSRILLMASMVIPLSLAALFLVGFPSVNHAFWSWFPLLNFSTVPLTDAIAQMPFNGFSVLLLVLVTVMLLCMGKQSLYIDSLIVLTPNALGRRARRVRENMTKYFKMVCLMCGIFGMLGVYGLALNVAIYLPTAITACAMWVGLALKNRFLGMEEK